MCRVKAEIKEGLVPSEKVARISTADGRVEEFIVSAKQVDDSTVAAGYIGRQNGKVLLELPRESTAGNWRVWVTEDKVIQNA